MKPRASIKNLLLFTTVLLAVQISCNIPGVESEATPTTNITQAYQTVNAKLTQAAASNPSSSTTPIPTDSGLATASATVSPQLTPSPPTTTAPQPTHTQSLACDQAAAGNPIDVTIPDDTVMPPGNSFTKIWRLKNVGSCTWTTAYTVAFFSGEQMNAPANVNLQEQVLPGQSVEVSVDMVAPDSPGEYQGNWKMRNAANNLFGIGPNGGSPFWVRIKVVATPTPTSTAPTPTNTPTASLTPPVIQARGVVKMIPGNRIDLDSLQLDNAEADDLSYETNAEGQRVLVPIENVQIGQYGNSVPGFEDCHSATLAGTSLPVDEMSPGIYYCYRTNQGLPGYLQATALNTDDSTLTLDILTWSIP